MVEFVYRRKRLLRGAGLALLAAGLGVATAIDAVAGIALVGAAAVLLAATQPLLLAHLRYRRARRAARGNGHRTGVDADDVDLDSF